MKYEKFLRNTAFGGLVGTLITLALACAFDSDVSTEMKRFYTFVFTACITMAAATLTLYGVFSNIENQQAQARQDRNRKLLAAKALLPNALSKMCETCRWGIRYSHSFQGYRDDLGFELFEQQSIDRLSLSDEIVSTFRDIIELSDDGKVADRLAGALREHQVFLARWKSEFSQDSPNMIVTSANVRERTIAWAYLYAITSSMFEYARNETHSLDETVTETEIRSAINIAGEVSMCASDFTEEIGLYARTFQRRFEI